jgi:hypothetical protein
MGRAGTSRVGAPAAQIHIKQPVIDLSADVSLVRQGTDANRQNRYFDDYSAVAAGSLND